MDLIEVLNLIIIAVVIMAIFTIFLLVFSLRFAKSSNNMRKKIWKYKKKC
ncbi:hypothetical protein SAMN04488072_109129 [Lentibacillus halodurans]|uniref:Uncharacterized protein n=1 Tax=Lentibacillus halodurans TaxID=237679 RepID=A0A1I0Z2U4_9BACI|nr:hypothetical protein SAMN04488072_109129 [Lentibacillus halodurans]